MPLFEKRWGSYARPVSRSWRCDVTYIKVRGRWAYLYRAVDKQGRTVDFFLSEKRDVTAAKQFLRKAIRKQGAPRVITLDGYAASHRAVSELKSAGAIPRRVRVRSSKYHNNIVEQDHRTVKQRVWLAKGYGSFWTARRTLLGIEAESMTGAGRARRVARGDAVGQARFISKLFGLAA